MLVADKLIKQFAGALLVASLVACGSGGVTPVPDAEVTPTLSPTVAPGVSPTPTDTVTPTPTIIPSPSATITPTVVPTDDVIVPTTVPTSEPTVEVSPTATPSPTPTAVPPNFTGWTDLQGQYLVASDGSRSLGDPSASFNSTRDQGSKIVYFNSENGNNTDAEVYWWDGENIIDSDGNTTNSDGYAYGTDPLKPNEDAIKPFANLVEAKSDDRLQTQQGSTKTWVADGLGGGYPDWFLFKRGQKHSKFKTYLYGGRSESEPMVVAAYGKESDGRAIIEPLLPEDPLDKTGLYYNYVGPFAAYNSGAETNWIHTHINSMEIRVKGLRILGSGSTMSSNGSGGPVSVVVEDCKFFNINGDNFSALPKKTVVYRSIITAGWNDGAHNQGYYASSYENQVTFDETIFYKNGFKENPLVNADPKRDIFSRNIYQGASAKMGHTYRGIISADGASGSPQMRHGALLENSLIVEGYFYISTESNAFPNPWLLADGQTGGGTAIIRNNVQFTTTIDTPNDPDTGSSGAAQPGTGMGIYGHTWGALVEGNIFSGSMILDDLGASPTSGWNGITFNIRFTESQQYLDYDYSTGKRVEKFYPEVYNHKDNVIRDNISYKMRSAMYLESDATSASNVEVSNNAFHVLSGAIRDTTDGTLTSPAQFNVTNNRFYSDNELPGDAWVADDNVLKPSSSAASSEGWSDPDRTLKRYVVEELGLTLLDWDDDPYLDTAQAASRKTANEPYDPTGLKTFMAVATNMRLGGANEAPASGKPSLTGDYAWDERFTGMAVVNWVRAGFGKEAVTD
jgi:hypothetical protein